jgi:hypothetical protein
MASEPDAPCGAVSAARRWVALETIVLEHDLEGRVLDVARYDEARKRNAQCLTTLGVRHVASYVTPDGARVISVFEAPDAEAVRRTARQLGYAYDRVWTATVVR